MAIVIATLGVAFAALVVWLGVRVVNRRERWAKRTLATVIGLPILYVFSFGPACWICSRFHTGIPIVGFVYHPVISAWFNSPRPIHAAGAWYTSLAARGTVLPGTMGDGKLVLYFLSSELEWSEFQSEYSQAHLE